MTDSFEGRTRRTMPCCNKGGAWVQSIFDSEIPCSPDMLNTQQLCWIGYTNQYCSSFPSHTKSAVGISLWITQIFGIKRERQRIPNNTYAQMCVALNLHSQASGQQLLISQNSRHTVHRYEYNFKNFISFYGLNSLASSNSELTSFRHVTELRQAIVRCKMST
jgi:hypothetical protein